ncbi:ATP-grasp domain-containing protein [Bartonella taylorii]|uniref:ATP-grasp domain-containing protein n=1 Tax=Bartonella taylorii TaxID=33046 RepID=A0A9Q9DLA0_BARTA|nr:ATP-grasp domain-containing protein [Bartonella taylorii]USP02125.1 ATP-grasp domain-containing protein [Bartonella taylorii]
MTLIERKAFQTPHDLSYTLSLSKVQMEQDQKTYGLQKIKLNLPQSWNLKHTYLNSILIETFFSGTLYSAETISYKGKTKLLATSSRIISDTPDFKELATALPLNKNTQELQEIEEWIKNILAAVSYQEGFAHTEFIVTEDGFEIVEINPRLGRRQISEALCQAFNTNIYKGFLEGALGREPELFRIGLLKLA